MADALSRIDTALRTTVQKNSDQRLQEEILTAIPSANVHIIEAFSRDELVYNVCMLRDHVGVRDKIQKPLKDPSGFSYLCRTETEIGYRDDRDSVGDEEEKRDGFHDIPPSQVLPSPNIPTLPTGLTNDSLGQFLLMMQQQQAAAQQQQMAMQQQQAVQMLAMQKQMLDLFQHTDRGADKRRRIS